MTNKETLEMFILLCTTIGTIGGTTWRIANLKARLEASIAKVERGASDDVDSLKDSLEKQIYLLDKLLMVGAKDATSEMNLIRHELKILELRVTPELENIKKRISGAIVFERLEKKIDKLSNIKKEPE